MKVNWKIFSQDIMKNDEIAPKNNIPEKLTQENKKEILKEKNQSLYLYITTVSSKTE